MHKNGQMSGLTFNVLLGIKLFASPLRWPSSKNDEKRKEKKIEKNKENKIEREKKRKEKWRKKKRKLKRIKKRKERRRMKRERRRKSWMLLIFKKVDPYATIENFSSSPTF